MGWNHGLRFLAILSCSAFWHTQVPVAAMIVQLLFYCVEKKRIRERREVGLSPASCSVLNPRAPPGATLCEVKRQLRKRSGLQIVRPDLNLELFNRLEPCHVEAE